MRIITKDDSIITIQRNKKHRLVLQELDEIEEGGCEGCYFYSDYKCRNDLFICSACTEKKIYVYKNK